MIKILCAMNAFQITCLALAALLVAAILGALGYCIYRACACKKPNYDILPYLDSAFEPQADKYASDLSALLKCRSISSKTDENIKDMYLCHDTIRELFPTIARKCEFTDFNGGLLIHWQGKTPYKPLVLMSHLDVVAARGKWDIDPFGGEIKDGIVHGRGAVDTKGNLIAILEACESLLNDSYSPLNDIYIFASSREEIGGEDAPQACRYLKDRNIRPQLVIDEGGAMLDKPLVGVSGRFAMIAMSERASARLIITATPTATKSGMLILAKFVKAMANVKLSKRAFTPEVMAMFKQLAPYMVAPMKFLFANTWLFGDLLRGALPKVSREAQAMLGATLAFGSCTDEENSAYPIGTATMSATIACTYYTDIDACIEKFNALCAKNGITATLLDTRRTVKPEQLGSQGYAVVADTVRAVFDGVVPVPFILFGGTDSRHFVSIADSVIRFAPLHLTNAEFRSFHNVNEQIHIDSLTGAVMFFRELIKKY